MEQARVFDEKSFANQLRPAWTPINVALMVLFFVTGLWILGLAWIGYMLYGKEIGLDFSNWGRAKRSVGKAFDGSSWSAGGSSGNQAFDDWRKAEMERIEQERRKLDDARKDFEEYMRELRRARDQEEFDAFRARWERRTNDGDATAV